MRTRLTTFDQIVRRSNTSCVDMLLILYTLANVECADIHFVSGF
jgi:hypothetical protein